MHKYIRISLYFSALFYIAVGQTSSPAYSPRQMKQHLATLYQDHRLTFFCEQPFTAKNELSLKRCKTCPFMSTQVEWMPIVPHALLAKHLLCYREKLCANQQGQRFKGTRCCQKSNAMYGKMSQDLHNFVPELKILKQYRRQYAFGLINNPHKTLQACHFYVDKQNKMVEVAPHLRGKIARTYLYMKDTYNIPLTQEQLTLYYDWHRQYPVDAWEKERNLRIKAIQGNGNPYIN